MAYTASNILANLLGLGPTIDRLNDLTLIETEVQKIIKTINDQLDVVKPAHFRNSAFIPAGAFGSGAKADNLSVHHTKAHNVIADTLVGVRTDLEQFASACADAKKFLKDADLTAAGDLSAIQNAVAALATGATSDRGSTAYQNAQVNHRYDRPSDHSSTDSSDKGDH